MPGNQELLRALRTNSILACLNEDELAETLRAGEMSRFPVRRVAYRRDTEITDVHFPIDAVLSVVSYMRDGSMIEVGTIGREGMSGIPLLLGSRMSPNDCFCQVTGTVFVMPVDTFRDLMASNKEFRRLLDRYLQAYVNMLGQLVACNRLHTVEERTARWLLMTNDRGGDHFQLTQEFLAMMLGSRRSSVTLAAAAMQRAGLISYARGWITVQNRAGLEETTCECYEVARAQFGMLLGNGKVAVSD